MNHWRNDGTSRITANIGRQTVSVFAIFDGSQASTVRDIITTNPTGRILLQSGYSTFTFSNPDIKPVRATFYVCSPKLSSPEASPLVTWQQGLIDQGGGATDILYLNESPKRVMRFNRFWRTTQRTVWIQPGKDFRMAFTKRKPFFNSDVTWQGFNQIKGFNKYLLVVLHGGISNDSSTKSQVSVGTGALDLVWTVRWGFKYAQDVISVNYGTTTLPTSYTVSEAQLNPGAPGADVVLTGTNQA